MADLEPEGLPEIGHRDDKAGRGCRLNIDPVAKAPAADHNGIDRKDCSIDGRVDVRSGWGTDVDAAALRPLCAVEVISEAVDGEPCVDGRRLG